MQYTAISFAPVQSFIRSSRKLRDLYGSSLLLSHLAHALYASAGSQLGADAVISPAGVSISRGVPNTLIIRGDYSATQARAALLGAWKQVLRSCRDWLENNVNPAAFTPAPEGWFGNWEAGWGASWKAVERHSWEVFHGQGPSISAARQALALAKQQRDWSIPNWTGESSSLSSAEAIVRPTMGRVVDPRHVNTSAALKEARDFLGQLRHSLGDAFAGVKEEISLLELVKRLITYPAILKTAFDLEQAFQLIQAPLAIAPSIAVEELLQRGFPHLSTQVPVQLAGDLEQSTEEATSEDKRPESIIWFMADGDRIGSHLERLAASGDKAETLQQFSHKIRTWATQLYAEVPKQMADPSFVEKERRATVVYAGGDDLLGALHERHPGDNDLKAQHLWDWLALFPSLWQQAQLPEQITVSMGLVWATARVPQREALQHARDAESTAKARGRDRFALRLLYASGNHLEWSCPWSWLEPIRSHYRDREGHQGVAASWRHLAEDLVWLKERHSLPTTARGLWEAYFPSIDLPPHPPPAASGDQRFQPSLAAPEQGRRFDQWLLDLGLLMAGLEKRGDKAVRRQARLARGQEVAA
jgi:CRISPR-associated protein Cmr2